MKRISVLWIFLLPVLLVAESLKVVTINVWSGLDYLGNAKMGEYENREKREIRYAFDGIFLITLSIPRTCMMNVSNLASIIWGKGLPSLSIAKNGR